MSGSSQIWKTFISFFVFFFVFFFLFYHFTRVWEGRWSSMRRIYIYIFWHTLPVCYCCISDTAVRLFPRDVCCAHAIKSPGHVGALDLANLGVFDLFMLVRLPRRFTLWSLDCTCRWVLLSCLLSPPPPYSTGAALNCHAGCSVYKTHSHGPQVPLLHPRPPLREINNLRASRNTLRHMLMGSLTLQTLLFLIFVFLLLGGDMRAHLHETEHLSRGRVRVDLLLHPPPSGLCSREYIFEMTK